MKNMTPSNVSAEERVEHAPIQFGGEAELDEKIRAALQAAGAGNETLKATK